MALGLLCDSGVEMGDRLQGDPELGHKGLHQEGIGCDDPLIRGQREGGSDGLETARDDLWRAHMMDLEEAFEGGATGELHRLQGGPARQEVAKDWGVFVLKPL